MAVAVDATGTGKTGVAATSLSEAVSSITVGSGSNRVLILHIQFGGDPGAITAVTWDTGGTNQAMTQVGIIHESDSLAFAAIYGLIAPTSGAKLLKVTWTNSVSWTYCMQSFTGADQGSVATTCINVVSGNT